MAPECRPPWMVKISVGSILRYTTVVSKSVPNSAVVGPVIAKTPRTTNASAIPKSDIHLTPRSKPDVRDPIAIATVTTSAVSKAVKGGLPSWSAKNGLPVRTDNPEQICSSPRTMVVVMPATIARMEMISMI